MIKVTVEPVAPSKVAKFELDPQETMKVQFVSDIPMDSNARTRDCNIGLVLTGRIYSGFGGTAGNKSDKLNEWSRSPAESADAYRKVTVQMITAGIVERQYIFPQAYIVEYKENFRDASGAGIYTLNLKRKMAGSVTKDDQAHISGGFAYKSDSK